MLRSAPSRRGDRSGRRSFAGVADAAIGGHVAEAFYVESDSPRYDLYREGCASTRVAAVRSCGITSRCCGPARVASVCCSTPRPAPRVALPATERRPLCAAERRSDIFEYALTECVAYRRISAIAPAWHRWTHKTSNIAGTVSDRCTGSTGTSGRPSSCDRLVGLLRGWSPVGEACRRESGATWRLARRVSDVRRPFRPMLPDGVAHMSASTGCSHRAVDMTLAGRASESELAPRRSRPASKIRASRRGTGCA